MKNLKILILSSNTYPSVRNSKVQKKYSQTMNTEIRFFGIKGALKNN